tara:strand:+ start:528 stop:737 length:210 start_codon:yes stop_codon:yes gene_type:complete
MNYTDPLANFSKDLQKSIHKRNQNNKLKNEENRIKEIKASPMYRMYRDRQNARARARRILMKAEDFVKN